MRPAAMRLPGLAALGLLAAAVALGGCGRKAGLDAPPGAAIDQSAGAVAERSGAEVNPATPNSQRRSPLDWLLN